MKKIMFLFGLFTLLATVSFAQDRSKSRVKPAKTSGWRDDSLLWVKKPGTATIKKPGTAKNTQSQDKLGNFEIQDVKAPENSEREAGSGQTTGRRVHKPIRRRPGN